MADDLPVKLVPVSKFGWMRRGDLQSNLGWVWEMPSGRLYLTSEVDMPRLEIHHDHPRYKDL